MQSRFNVFAAAACAAAIVVTAAGAHAADGYRLSGPLVRDNLAVYQVHGNPGGGAAPLTLEQAQAQGAIRIHESEPHPLKVENLSDRSVFIQLGDLITGGLQDQVAGTSVLLPPHSGLTPLVTFCVDPFRSSARDGDDPKLFSALGALFPSRMARLSILSGSPEGITVAKIREQGVWWSVDSLRAALSQKLGMPLETPRDVHWMLKSDSRANTILAARRGVWTTSLPLAMESPALAQAQKPIMDAFERTGAQGDDVVGAVFAIDGKVVGAEIYQSHALFSAMWAKILRAYATEALAAETSDAAPPSLADVSAFLAAAEQGDARERALGRQAHLRDSAAAIYVETAGGTHRSFVAKLDPAATPLAPEALLVQMLETGEADGRSLASLRELGNIILHNNPDADGWSATLPLTPDTAAQRPGAESDLGITGKLTLFLVLAFLARRIWRRFAGPALRKGVAIVARAGRGLAQFARHTTATAAAGALALTQAAVLLCWAAWHGMLALIARAIVPVARRAYAPVRTMPTLRPVSMH